MEDEMFRLTSKDGKLAVERRKVEVEKPEISPLMQVYQVVAKPVVESVLEGYIGTVIAYGQSCTGKTFTLGRLGDEDTAALGIMVRSMVNQSLKCGLGCYQNK